MTRRTYFIALMAAAAIPLYGTPRDEMSWLERVTAVEMSVTNKLHLITPDRVELAALRAVEAEICSLKPPNPAERSPEILDRILRLKLRVLRRFQEATSSGKLFAPRPLNKGFNTDFHVWNVPGGYFRSKPEEGI